MIRFLMVLCATVAAYDDHEFFFDSNEHEYFSPSDHVRVTRDGGSYGSGFYGSYSPTSYASEASSELSPLINSEIERIRSGRAAAAADSGSVEDYTGGNFKSDYGFGGFGSRDSREIDGLDYGSSFGGDTGAGLGLGAYSTDGGSSGSRGARGLYYPGLIGLGYGSGGYGGGGSGEYGSGYGSGYTGSGGYDYGGAGAGLIGFGSGGYD